MMRLTPGAQRTPPFSFEKNSEAFTTSGEISTMSAVRVVPGASADAAVTHAQALEMVALLTVQSSREDMKKVALRIELSR